MAEHVEVMALHRYFVWADRMRVHFDGVLAMRAEGKAEKGDIHTLPYMAYWYGGMYVVIEGWRELRLSDPTVDALLNSANVELLRRYRNGAFHFQRKYMDERFADFWGEADTPRWIRELREAFSQWFLKYLAENRHRHTGESRDTTTENAQ
jgi:hypothetical protein